MYNFFVSIHFKKQLKPLAKKYKSLKQQLISVLKNFNKENCSSLGSSVYKVRLSIAELHKGKNKAFRLIVLLIEAENLIVPLTVYFKGDKANISQQEIIVHTRQVKNEISQ